MHTHTLTHTYTYTHTQTSTMHDLMSASLHGAKPTINPPTNSASPFFVSLPLLLSFNIIKGEMCIYLNKVQIADLFMTINMTWPQVVAGNKVRSLIHFIYFLYILLYCLVNHSKYVGSWRLPGFYVGQLTHPSEQFPF